MTVPKPTDTQTITIQDTKYKVRPRIHGLALHIILAPEEHAGKLIVPNWESKSLMVVTNVYYAHRQTAHVQLGHGCDLQSGEMKTLAEVKTAARDMNLAALGMRHSDDIADLREKFHHLTRVHIQVLGRPRNPDKQKALIQLAALDAFYDRRGRKNPGVIATRALTVEERIRARQAAIMRIDPHIEKRQRAFTQMILESEIMLNAVRQFIDFQLHAQPGFSNPSAPPDDPRVLIEQLKYYQRELKKLDFAPYRSMATLTINDFREAQMEVGKDNEQYRIILRRCEVALAIMTQRVKIERMIFRAFRRRHRMIHDNWDHDVSCATVAGIGDTLARIDDRMIVKPCCRQSAEKLYEAVGLFDVRPWKEEQFDRLLAILKEAAAFL